MNGDNDVTIAVERRGRTVLVSLVGGVDFRSVSRLRETLTDPIVEDHDRIIVDLSLLTSIDSLGLGVLVAAWKRARAAGISMVLWRPSSKAAAVLQISRLDRVITVVDDKVTDPFAA